MPEVFQTSFCTSGIKQRYTYVLSLTPPKLKDEILEKVASTPIYWINLKSEIL